MVVGYRGDGRFHLGINRDIDREQDFRVSRRPENGTSFFPKSLPWITIPFKARPLQAIPHLNPAS